MLTACKIYNESPSIISSVLHGFSFLLRGGLEVKGALRLVLLFDFLQPSCTNWVIEIIHRQIVQMPMKNNSAEQLFCCWALCVIHNKHNAALMFWFKHLDKENGAFVWVPLITSRANGYTCVNSLFCFVYWAALTAAATLNYFWPSSKQPQHCPLDSQIAWQCFSLTFNLRDGLGRLWEHSKVVIFRVCSLIWHNKFTAGVSEEGEGKQEVRREQGTKVKIG